MGETAARRHQRASGAQAAGVEDGAREIIVFRVGMERFAMDVSLVEAVTEMPEVRPVPAMPPHMLGVCELRGSLIPVYTPAVALNVTLEESGSAIIAWAGRTGVSGGRRIAVAIAGADGVIAFDPGGWSGLGGAPPRQGLVRGVSTQGGQLTTLIDAAAFLTACTRGRTAEDP
jgi:chemotaxis signal transduction protein